MTGMAFSTEPGSITATQTNFRQRASQVTMAWHKSGIIPLAYTSEKHGSTMPEKTDGETDVKTP